MNIHFDNITLFENLNFNTVIKIKVGSHLYKLDNENSDTDFLSLYLETCDNRNSFLWEHHQLQFKDDLIDYNFATLQSFIRNTLTGDATINFEVLFSNDLKHSDLKWLYEMRHDFINYNIIRSYLGLAKRDYKYWVKDITKFKKDTIPSNKKLSHFVRGIIFAKNLLENNFSLDLSNTATFNNINDYILLKLIKNNEMNNTKLVADYFFNLMNDLRDVLNNKLNNKELTKYMRSDKLRLLDSHLHRFITTTVLKKGCLKKLDYDSLFYDVLEKGVEY